MTSVAFSRNGKILATAGGDRKVTVYSGIEDGSAAGIKARGLAVVSQTSGGVDFPDGVTACAIGGRNSQLLVATASNSLRAFSLPDLLSGSKSPETIDCPNAHAEGRVIQDVALAPKGNFMLSMTNDTEIKLFSFPAEGKPVETIKTTAKNHQLALSPNGEYFAVAALSSEVRVWRVDTGAARTPGANDGAPTGVTKAVTLTGHTRAVWSVGWSWDCSFCATTSKDQTWRVYDMNAGMNFGKCLASGPSSLGEARQVALSTDGSTIALCVNEAIQLVSTKDSTVLDTIDGAHGLTITGCVFSPDGKLLASVSDDQFLKLWSVPQP